MYSNDDWVIAKPVTFDDFYHGSNGQVIRTDFKVGKGSTTRINNYGANMWLKSLQFNNELYDKVYGRMDRYAVFHAPLLLDRQIMTDFTDKFSNTVAKTSQNKFRTEQDIQFEFNYSNFIIGENNLNPLGLYLKELDTNKDDWIDSGKCKGEIQLSF